MAPWSMVPGGPMVTVIAVAAVTVCVIAWLTAVLVRRERRRGETSAEGLRIESAASAGVREARRRACAGRDMATASTDVYLRDR
ncbi:hypothetical protein GCM10012287_05450 [Streptomyces daqingensis]|uniref:Uncharacterized protein n=2 Tax=Streptomyces daqingensis TaxID=1472640 RepID=A0ABQ2LU38_9ACTN|nr:hypothetical protein GCM10012287_05450 [Streptomyces daqingensis]